MVYKRPDDVRLVSDVPICCNLVVATDMLDGGADRIQDPVPRRCGWDPGSITWEYGSTLLDPQSWIHILGSIFLDPHSWILSCISDSFTVAVVLLLLLPAVLISLLNCCCCCCCYCHPGLISSGILPAVRHAQGSLLTHDALCIPDGLEVWAAAADMSCPAVCGMQLPALDAYR